jgi:dihydroorotase (multifunctional complex type)
MQKFDLVIRHGKAILPAQGEQQVDIAVRDGRIAALLAPGLGVDASETLDAAGLIVMPGAIDVHLHLGHGKDISRPRVPEDAAQETAAAVSGGVTAFIPYLMATEPFETIFEDVRSVTEAGARIDFGYHFIISTEEQLAGVPRYATEYGAPSFKIFMNNRGGEGARLGLPDTDDGFLLRLCESAAASGGIVCPHPETIELAWVTRKRAQAADPKGTGGLTTWNASRPPFVEADAVQRAAYISGTVDCPLYVVHTSSAEALEAAVRLRSSRRTVHVETCPHYLTHDVGWSGGDVGKINPPLRETSDREALWEGIRNGSVDTVATDHVHRDVSSKAGGIWTASPGCPGLDTLLPVMLSEGHHKRGIPLSRVAELTATNPARIMGFGDRKGTIAVELDADLALIDMNGVTDVSNDRTRSSAGYSIYDGWKLRGRVVHTLVRGAFAMRDGVLDDACVGRGRYIRRKLAA